MAPPSPPRCADRILVIHTAFLGDIILATPFLSALRAAYPEAEIRFLTTGGGTALLKPNPWGVIPVAYHKRGSDSGITGLVRKVKELRKFRPELVFCLHRSIRSAIFTKLVGGESWGFQEAAGSFLFSHRVSRAGYQYEAEKNLALLREFLQKDGFSPYPQLSASSADEAEAESLLNGTQEFIVMAPSSVWATKRWPGEKFGELAARVWKEKGLRTAVVGSDAAEDKQAAADLIATFRQLVPGETPLDLSGKTSLGGLKSVLCKAKLVVSNDSSPLHLALAMGTKAVGVFGPTTKELGFFPLAPPGQSATAELNGLSCRPCGLHGHRQCPLGHFRCMRDLGVDQVYAEVKNLLWP